MKIPLPDKLFRIKAPLKYKIVSLVILAIILPALMFSVILSSISRRVVRESIFSRQQEIVSRLADRINAQLDRHYRLLSLHQDMAFFSRAQQLSAARSILSQGAAFSEVALVDTRGQELWKIRREGAAADLVNRARRSEYRRARNGKGFISQLYFSEEHNPFLIVSVPLRRRSGVLVAKLNFQELWQWIAEVKIGETGQAFIVDRKGMLIAHREPERVLAHSNFSSLPVVRDYLDNRRPAADRWQEYRDERGEKVVALYQSIPRLGWAVVIQIPSREVYAPVRQMYHNILLWSLVWTVVFLFVGFKVVQLIAGPITLLQSGAQQITHGKLDIKLDIATGDELEDLARSFEKMAESLKQLESLRQDLTRMIIHDLKSPLSGIMGGVDYLDSGLLGDVSADQHKVLKLVKKSSENMLSMIQNLLDVARMEEGKLELHREATDLSAMLVERQSQYQPLTHNEEKTLTLDIEPGVPPAYVDRHLVERVVNNLLTNAFNHTSTGGAIRLGLRKLAGMVEVTVADNGAGIPKEYLRKIFEKFVQVERRQAHLRTGAGLGLTFCRMAVEAHGGAIRVESELDKGSAFIFTLPLELVPKCGITPEGQV